MPIFSAFFFISQFSFGQKLEYGLAVGGVSYSGDLHRGYDITNQSIGIQGLYRINVSQDIAFKTALMYGRMKGDDSKPIDALSEERLASFSRSIIEGSAVFEYHFIDYLHEHSTFKWTPYLFAGIGFTNIINMDRSVDDFSSIQPVIPFGGGVKHLIGKQFSAAVEFGARKTFFDKLDRISNSNVYDKTEFQFGNPADNDWYYFLNVSVSYILFKIPCTYRYVPNKTLYSR